MTALAAVVAPGDTLHDRDGMTLEGTVKIENKEANGCHVLEARRAAEGCERMKANHGQPLHVWRLECKHSASGAQEAGRAARGQPTEAVV